MEFTYIKNNKTIIVPEGVKIIPDEAFLNQEDVEEIILPDSLMYIGHSAFKGCKRLKKVNLPDGIKIIEDAAFAGCESLEEIKLPKDLELLACDLFSCCTNLKRIIPNERLKHIDSYALFNCKSLEDFPIPHTLKSIGRMALMCCESIEEIHIPESVTNIDTAAFAFMKSLRRITVDKNNENYLSDEDDTLLSKDGLIIQFALASPKEEYIVGYYPQSFGTMTLEDGTEEELKSNVVAYNIGDYAFAGAKNLKKIIINSELESMASHTFQDCDNLKKLEIFTSFFGKTLLFTIYKSYKEEANIPFEEIIIGEGVDTICGGLNELFKNATTVQLPSTLEQLNEEVFTKSSKLKRLVIPSGIKVISPNTFHDNTTLVFADFGEVPATNFNMLQTKTDPNIYLRNHEKNNTRIFALKDGTYYVKYADYDTVRITKDEIGSLSNTSSQLEEDPDKIISYITDLLIINRENYRILSQIWMNKDFERLFAKFIKDSELSSAITEKKVAASIEEIMKKSGVTDEFLFSGLLIRKVDKEELIKILQNYNNSISRFFRLSKPRKDDDEDLNVDKLIVFCNILEKYRRYDRFFYNEVLFKRSDIKNQELLIAHFNKNIKSLLLNSETLNDSYGNNLDDLLNLCNALGVFSPDERISQRMSTFINEKMFNKNSKTRVTGNTIHTMFSDLRPREEIDYEFIEFFIENYDRLLEEEKKTSGIISRIYNSFREISKTSTSHRGEQRHLKVTVDKCLDFFISERFEGVTEENKGLALLLQKYYSESYALKVGEMIVNQSKNAPRNIFASTDSEKEDLKENNEDDFSYEWLPKQDYENLILGKHCSCCAHILGAGAGIMRASMVSDNCQNLVIKNENGDIIAKMTIYVNKKQGYAVFNTAEININYQSPEHLERIYEAFTRGTKKFVEKYNENNTPPITIVTIGEYRNTLKFNLGNVETPLLDTPNYSEFSYDANGKTYGKYDGDSKNKQILVYKK